jgi:hypothetical protein
MRLTPGSNVKKLFMVIIYKYSLEARVGLSRQVSCLWEKPGAYPRGRNLKGSPLR